MIPIARITKELAEKIDGIFGGLDIWDSPSVYTPPYLFLDLSEKAKLVDPSYLDRQISVDIRFHPELDANESYDMDIMQAVIEGLSTLTQLKVARRNLKLINPSYRIVDRVLHFSYQLQFTDNYTPQGDEPTNLATELNMEVKYAK